MCIRDRHWIAYVGIHNWYYFGWALYKESINEDTTFESLGIDSLDIVEMVVDLEDELGIELELNDKITTIGELAEFVESKL